MSEEQVVVIQPHAEVVWAAIKRRDMDDETLSQLQSVVPEAAAKQGKQPVLLDMTAVEFVPSSALGSLVMLNRRFKQEGRRFLLVGVHPQIRTTLAATRLDKLFEIHPGVEEALARVRGST
jgi:anti-sigma B factor antagonist